ncbi:OmpA family [Beggiatoa alba B18LD]|uniref:OmpA family n=2 Tax=Beggiatoa alba TaxID=1022 RepID=I3CBH4_9GAMM|nr:OmpA family [Beggiatoa alba B18LD]
MMTTMDEYKQLRQLLSHEEENLKKIVYQLLKDLREFSSGINQVLDEHSHQLDEIHQQWFDVQTDVAQYQTTLKNQTLQVTEQQQQLKTVESSLQKYIDAQHQRLNNLEKYHPAELVKRLSEFEQRGQALQREIATHEASLKQQALELEEKNKSLATIEAYIQLQLDQQISRLNALEKHHPAELVKRITSAEQQWQQLYQSVQAQQADLKTQTEALNATAKRLSTNEKSLQESVITLATLQHQLSNHDHQLAHLVETSPSQQVAQLSLITKEHTRLLNELMQDKAQLATQAEALQTQLVQQVERLQILERDHPAELVQRLADIEVRWQEIKEIEARLTNTEGRITDLAHILPHAIRQASAQHIHDGLNNNEAELTESLKEPVKNCLKQSVNEDTQSLADALFPIMGPAIRKSINESLKGLIQDLNMRLEHSVLSPRGIGWRIEAMRSGRSFAEVVLQNTLVYRVEEIFLIHRQTGLLLQHIHQEDSTLGDSDAISGMLTAIQDFTRDSFSKDKTEELDRIELGSYTVWLERAPHAVLACVIRGVPPYEFRHLMKAILEKLHARYGRELENFEGDNTTFETTQPLLQNALQSQKKEEETARAKRFFSMPLLVVLFLLLLGIGYGSYRYWQWQQTLENYIAALKQTHGIVFIEGETRNGKLQVRALRDPLAIDPANLAQQYAVADRVELHTQPHYDLTPEFILQRAQQRLQPPKTVQLQVTEVSTLKITGYATPAWIESVPTKALQVVGVTDINVSELENIDQFLLKQAQTRLKPPTTFTQLTVKDTVLTLKGEVEAADYLRITSETPQLTGYAEIDTTGLINVTQQLQELEHQISAINIYFGEDYNFSDSQETNLTQLSNLIKQIITLAERHQKHLVFQISGYTDGLGTQLHNQTLSQQRAERVYHELSIRGIETRYLQIVPPLNIPFGDIAPNYLERRASIKIQQSVQGLI